MLYRANLWILTWIMLIVSSITFAQTENDAQRNHKKEVRDLIKNEKIEAALALAQKGVAKHKTEGWYEFQLGEVYLNNIKDDELAIAAFDRAREKKFMSIWVEHRKGQALMNSKRYQAAIVEFNQAINRSREVEKLFSKNQTDKTNLIHREMSTRYGKVAKCYFYTGDVDNFLVAAKYAAELNSSNGKIRQLFDARMENGYDELAQGNYKPALRYFEKAFKSPVMDWEKEKNLRMYVKELIKVTKKRVDLGKIEPVYVHNIGVLLVNNVDFTYKNKEGKLVSIKESLRPGEKIIANRRILVVKAITEAMSDGNLSIKPTMIDINSPLRRVHAFPKGKYYPDWRYYKGAGEEILPYVDSNDTFIWCSNAIHGSGHGGAGSFPLPFGTKSPQRGFIELNPMHTVNLWFHEFFHVVEQMSGISPAHGHHASKRKFHPEWKGKTNNSMDYYQWQFNNTVKNKGWENLNFSSKKYDFDVSETSVVASWGEDEFEGIKHVYKFNLENGIQSEKLEVIPLYIKGNGSASISELSLWDDENRISENLKMTILSKSNSHEIYMLEFSKKVSNEIILKISIENELTKNCNGVILLRKSD